MSLQRPPTRGAMVGPDGRVSPEWLAWFNDLMEQMDALEESSGDSTGGGTSTGTGDVTGPSVAGPGNLAAFSDTTGKVIRDSGESPATIKQSAVSMAIAEIIPVDLASEVENRLPLANFAQAAAASRLLGRGDSGAGDYEDIQLGSGLSMSGTTLNASVSAYYKPLTFGTEPLSFVSDGAGDVVMVPFTP